jgi:hypothetical protein
MTTYLTNDGWAIKKGYKHFVRYIVTTLAAASITTGDYFFYNNGSVDYYVWMDKNGDGTTDDPGPLGSKTGVPVDISGATTAIDVANALMTAIDALTGSNAEAEDDVVYITNVSNDNDSSMSDSNTGFTFSSDGFLPNNDYPSAITLTSFREDAKAIMDSNVRGTPSATDTNYLRNLEYRMVELMMDEEQGRETEDGRPIYIPRDYLFQRDRITLAGIGSTGFTRGTSH